MSTIKLGPIATNARVILLVPTAINVLLTFTLTGHVMFSVNLWLRSTTVLIWELEVVWVTGLVLIVILVSVIIIDQIVPRSAMKLLITHAMIQETDSAENTTILENSVTHIANQ